jgi:hypothetical protein
MKIWHSCGVLTVTLLMASGWSFGQAMASFSPGVQRIISAPAAGSNQAKAEILREIDDPHNGDCWLLERNPVHPAGPGRLVLASVGKRTSPDKVQTAIGAEPVLPVIRSGDRVVVEEHSAQADARLEAVAIGPALAGASFNVRLAIGSQIVRVLAVSPGRAVVQETTR